MITPLQLGLRRLRVGLYPVEHATGFVHALQFGVFHVVAGADFTDNESTRVAALSSVRISSAPLAIAANGSSMSAGQLLAFMRRRRWAL